MAEHLISERLVEVISNRSAGNAKSPGQPPLPNFQGHFHGHEGEPGRLDIAEASLGMGRTSTEAPAVVFLSVMFNPSSTPSRLAPGRFLVLVPIDLD
jgi:hypothetical protein